MSTAADPVVEEGRDRLAVIDLEVYGLPGVLKAAYALTGRCYVHLQRREEKWIEIRLRGKRAGTDPDQEVREFFNQLLDERLREMLAKETAGIRDQLMAHALGRTSLVRPEGSRAQGEETSLNVAVR
ncbi:MAG TPA: His-Xaa-Ser system protein HxsD [Opitutaceae bacterium]|nr:His-Xaa-Ser system protein HxsD [Opitutaceae bacterium]